MAVWLAVADKQVWCPVVGGQMLQMHGCCRLGNQWHLHMAAQRAEQMAALGRLRNLCRDAGGHAPPATELQRLQADDSCQAAPSWL